LGHESGKATLNIEVEKRGRVGAEREMLAESVDVDGAVPQYMRARKRRKEKTHCD
jgi:hypothetical protein